MSVRHFFFILLFFFVRQLCFGQAITGQVTNAIDDSPLDYVSIGVIGMDVGTVSDVNGNYTLEISDEYDDQVLRFSYIGYEDIEIRVKDFRSQMSYDVQLSPVAYQLPHVVITPDILGRKTLGHTGNSKLTTAVFGEYRLGFEHAVRMRLSKNEKAIIEKININIARCTFDSLHYRVNVYNIKGRKKIKSILKKPIYIKLKKEEIIDQISFNIEDEKVMVKGDFLISLEHIDDLGEGEIAFSSNNARKTYVRKTSQGKWKIVDVGISISADVIIIK